MISLKFPLRIILILLLILVLPINATAQRGTHSPQATDRYVSPAGTDGGGCTNPSNPCRTIDYARLQSSAGDTIHLAAGEYIEHVSLYVGLNLVGAGAESTIINGNGVDRVVYVFSDPVPSTISHLTIRNGASEFAGGLGNLSQLTLDHVIIEDNTVSDQGGGIYNSGELTILNSIVRNNTASSVGGGLMNHGQAVIRNSAFIGNQVPETGAYGGGIANNLDATLELTNVTLSQNQAPWSAGLSNGGSADLVNVTIADNIGNGIGAFYIGSVVNSILSGNTQDNCSDDLYGLTSLGHNLESGANCGFSEPGDMQDTPTLLQPLGYYSSMIPTHNLFDTSPALDSADPAYCPDTDARGVARPIDGDGTGVAVCDRGAHEYNPATDAPRLYLPLVAKGL